MCKNSHPVILFARAKNAPPTILPKGTLINSLLF